MTAKTTPHPTAYGGHLPLEGKAKGYKIAIMRNPLASPKGAKRLAARTLAVPPRTQHAAFRPWDGRNEGKLSDKV